MKHPPRQQNSKGARGECLKSTAIVLAGAILGAMGLIAWHTLMTAKDSEGQPFKLKLSGAPQQSASKAAVLDVVRGSGQQVQPSQTTPRHIRIDASVALPSGASDLAVSAAALWKVASGDENTYGALTAEELSITAKYEQELFCRDSGTLDILSGDQDRTPLTANSTLLKYSPLPLYLAVYQNTQDVISNAVLQGKQWEAKELGDIMSAMETDVPGQSKDSKGLFVDVGAHVGVFALQMAAKGYETIAFEHTNWGNGIPVRGHNLTHALQKSGLGLATGHTVRGTAKVDTLSHVLKGRDIKVLKIDVEGYEPYVIEGARQLLKENTVWFIVMEHNKAALKASYGEPGKPYQHILELMSLGYKVGYSFTGPYLNDAEVIRIGESTDLKDCALCNLYFVNKKLLPKGR